MRKTPIHYEKDFEKNWDEEKKAGWERLKVRLNITEEPTPPPIPQKKNFFSSPARLVTVCASVALLIGVGIGVGIVFYNPPAQQMQSSSSALPPDENRYCTQSEYTIEETEMTLKEYSLQQDGKVLYFDWYNQIEELSNAKYFLNETQEIIAFREIFYNITTNYYITLYITDNHTEIEDLEKIKNSCTEITFVGELPVQYYFYKTKGAIMWEFDGYRYYMEVQNIMSQDELFALVEELLRE